MEPKQITRLERIATQIQATKANLSGSCFTDVNLSGAAFSDINFSGMTIENANMSGVRINNVNLSGAAISDCVTAHMTIEGIEVSALLAAYRQIQSRKE